MQKLIGHKIFSVYSNVLWHCVSDHEYRNNNIDNNNLIMFYKPSFPREQANRRGHFTSQGNTLEELECQTIIPIGRLYIKMLSCCYALSRAGDFYTK